MCGIIGLLRPKPEPRAIPDLDQLIPQLDRVLDALPEGALRTGSMAAALQTAGEALESLAEGLPALDCVVAVARQLEAAEALTARLRLISGRVMALERALDEEGSPGASSSIEEINRLLVWVKDLAWRLQWDRIATSRRAAELIPGGVEIARVAALLSIQQSLQAIDRMEVRGRDSAGLHLLLSGHGLASEDVAALVDPRSDSLFRSRSARLVNGALSLVYKTAAEIGELGDNVRELRSQIREDDLLRRALESADVEVAVLGHTRWASVGIISEPNAHPLDERAVRWEDSTTLAESTAACFAVLNGDVDNYAELMAERKISFEREITTDAKVITALCAARRLEGLEPAEAFRETVASFEGSVAIGVGFADQPMQLHLALRGSGQALYVGVAEDCLIAASELYGVVEVTDTYLRLDGETPGNPENAAASRGQVVRLDPSRGLGPSGITRWSYDGTLLPIEAEHLRHAEMTTRDVDRRDYPHFLLKELSEAPSSWAKTLRGKLERQGSTYEVRLGPESLPPSVVERLQRGTIRRIRVIGQGTAAVAGQAVAAALRSSLRGSEIREVTALPATELSGFGLSDDMADTLIIAISQSGTTTDTNRTVDLVRSRGAAVLAIVNRRQSDLTDKAEGVLYTSDGRDLEMSVASTKAFYSQVAAGFLMAIAIADSLGLASDADRSTLLHALHDLPGLMHQLLERRESIGEIAAALAPRKRYWAVVGNGLNRIAAEEVRIKLSELCYKSIPCDATEDKKHIDLSCEPLILVAAAGLSGSTADDVSKEIAIYGAHKATPIVIASDDDARFSGAAACIRVPRAHPQLDFVLAALAGHLFGYEAAKAIDQSARPLRAIRSEIERLAAETLQADGGGSTVGASDDEEPSALAPAFREDPLSSLRPTVEDSAQSFLAGLAQDRYDGHLEVSTGSELKLLLHVALGDVPLQSFARLQSRPGTPAEVLDCLHDALSQAIDELTRPIDAIKHQAKTVTVGISRSDEAFMGVPLVREVLAAGTGRERLTYSCLRTLAHLDPVVVGVLGHTRYEIDAGTEDDAKIRVVHTGGLSAGLTSRTEKDPVLRGTKRAVAREAEPLVARGSADGRLFLLVPEVVGARTVGLVLLHVELRATASTAVVRSVLTSYRGRYGRLRDAVMETEPNFREEVLEQISIEDLLVKPVQELAREWLTRRDGGTAEASALGETSNSVRARS